MVTLPNSIETYLQEAGFTPTEILILKRLLEGQALTLRELASKTGKSTGVLDQATKKLIERKIVTRENINDTSKYAISSLDAINTWMAKDMDQRHAVLDRKRQDFEAFISTVEHESSRPEMEFFEGMEGIQQAFTKLLQMDEREWILFTPSTMREEDDPLLEFRVDLFRQRRRKKTFMRVISPNVPLGRRFQSRDVYEYRETKLVKPEDFPVSFEQLIVGNTVACIDVEQQKASFIHYPELASGQRKMFDMLWCRAGEEPSAGDECKTCIANANNTQPGLETMVLSSLREFFMSRSSVITLGLLGLAAAAMTWGLYGNNVRLNTERVRDKVLAIASTGSELFDAYDIELLQLESDMNRAQYTKVVESLNTIREYNEGLKYVYIIRPTNEEDMFEFVADSYGLDIGKGIDFNNDGVIGPEDEIPILGMPYDVSEIPGAREGLKRPTAIADSFTDQWGTFISGFAPIKDDNGKTIAVLGVDKVAEDVTSLTLDTFSPIYYFLGFFLFFVLIRLAAFHRSLLGELIELTKTKKFLIPLTACAFIALVLTGGMYKYTLELMKENVSNQLLSIVATASPEIKVSDLNAVRIAEDMRKPEYQRLYEKLNEIRDQNTKLNLQYAYIMRPAELEGMYEFVADADSNYFLPEDPSNPDATEVLPPGTQYKVDQLAQAKEEEELLLKEPMADKNVTTDKWGTYLSASAPIFDDNGNGIAIIGVDMDIGVFYEKVNNRFKPYIWFLSAFITLIAARVFLICKSN